MAIRTLIALGAAVLSTAAYADVCSTLQQQYLVAGTGNGAPLTSARPAADLSSLNSSLQIAQASAQANRCNSGILGLFGPGPSPACPAIMQQVNQLQAQIRQAYSSNAGAGGGGGIFGGFFGPPPTPSPRDQIRNQLIFNGCQIPPDNPYGAGGYRTLCVRTCDGYYFPIEYGTSADHFQADAQTCQTLYGANSQAQLFVMPSEGDVADAQPLDGGKNYGDQPYAFSYRTSLNTSCVAQLQSNVATLTASTAGSSVGSPQTALISTAPTGPALARNGDPVPIPHVAQNRFEDPETLANTAGNLNPLTAIAPVATASTGLNGIRVVGAGYYNDILDQQPTTSVAPTAPAAASSAVVTR